MGAWTHSTSQGYGRKYSVTCDHHPLESRFGIKEMISVVWNPTVCVVCVCVSMLIQLQRVLCPISLWFVSRHSSVNQLICMKELHNHGHSLVLWSKMFQRVLKQG